MMQEPSRGGSVAGGRFGWRGTSAVFGLVLDLIVSGCAGPVQAPVNLSEPGWRVSEASVVWRPRGSAPELVGELLVAVNPDGRRLVQFSKQTLPVVTAQMDAAGWSLSSSLRARRYGGRGSPTDRVPWFQFTRLPPVPPFSGRWHWESAAGGGWRLANPSTGEFVEGAAP
jgi:hypothetical protein